MNTLLNQPVAEYDFNRMEFAADSLAYRSKLRMSRIRLAEILGVTANTIRGIETRKFKPDLEVYWAYCILLEKDPLHYLSKKHT